MIKTKYSAVLAVLFSLVVITVFSLVYYLYLYPGHYVDRFKSMDEFTVWLKQKGYLAEYRSALPAFSLDIYKAREASKLSINGKDRHCYLFRHRSAWENMEKNQATIFNAFAQTGGNNSDQMSKISNYFNVRCFE